MPTPYKGVCNVCGNAFEGKTSGGSKRAQCSDVCEDAFLVAQAVQHDDAMDARLNDRERKRRTLKNAKVVRDVLRFNAHVRRHLANPKLGKKLNTRQMLAWARSRGLKRKRPQ